MPPLTLDAIRRFPFGIAPSEQQRQSLVEFSDLTRRTGQHVRAEHRARGYEEDRVIGEYTAGSEIDDTDDTFTIRFLFAFWRLCEQRIATTGESVTLPA